MLKQKYLIPPTIRESVMIQLSVELTVKDERINSLRMKEEGGTFSVKKMAPQK